MRRVLFAFLAGGALVLVASRASAQPSTASSAAALQLFDEGSRLMNEGKYAEACEKLSRSQQVSPNGGTLFVLAECYVKNGQVASAWTAYKEAATRAQAAGKDDAERLAVAALQATEPNVTWVTLVVADAPGLVVFRDGQQVARPEWGIAVPLDPGMHRFEARANGRKAWSSDLRVSSDAGQKLQVDVPRLEADVAPSTGGPLDAKGSSWGTQRYVGIGTAAAGVAGLVVGTIFGLRASSKNDEAASHCLDDRYCDGDGLRLDDEGRSAGTVSTVAFIAGGAALVGGAILFFTARPAPASGGASTSAGRGVRVGGAGAPGIGGSRGAFSLGVSGSF